MYKKVRLYTELDSRWTNKLQRKSELEMWGFVGADFYPIAKKYPIVKKFKILGQCLT